MPAAAISLVGTAYAASKGASATGRASALAAEGTRSALEQRQKFFDIGQENLAPYMEIGNEAVDQIRSVFLEGNMDEFYESADYKFNLEQGEQALERKQGAAGSRFGGRALKEAAQFSQGLASGEFNNFFNRLSSVANLGAGAAAGSTSAANVAGSGMASTIQAGASDQANLALQRGQSMNQAVQGGLSNLTTLSTYNDLMKTLQPQPVTPQQDYNSGSVTSMPSIFNK